MRADAYFGSCFTKKASALVGYREGGSINQSIISLFQFGFQSSITASVSEREILNEMKLEIVQLKYMLYKHQLHKLIYSYTTIFFFFESFNFSFRLLYTVVRKYSDQELFLFQRAKSSSWK